MNSYSASDYVYVAGYFNPGDGGQGGFTPNGTSCSNFDHGSIVKDGNGNCWYRQNLDGSVEQFNAIPVTSGDGTSVNASTGIFNKVIKAAQTAGLGAVSIRGRPGSCSSGCGSRYQLDSGLKILQGMKLQCLTAPAGQSEDATGKATGDYSAIPFTLIVPSSSTIQLGQAAQTQGCEIQQAGFVPPPSTPTYRSLMNNAASFAGTAITFGAGSPANGTGDNAEVRDTTIIGFNTGIYSNKNSDIKLVNVMDDSSRCADIENATQGVSTIDRFYCYPLLTRNIANAQPSLFISNIANNSGVYRVTFFTPCNSTDHTGDATDCNNYPANNDTAWISNPQGAESSGGRWTLTNYSTSTTPAYCDLQNSSTSSLTASGTFAAGATQIASVPANSTTISAVSQGAAFGYSSQNHLIRLTVGSTTGLSPGKLVSVSGFTGADAPEANGVWFVDGVGSGTVDLHNSVFVNAVSGLSAPKLEWGYPSAGQTVSGTGIASGTRVTTVWPAEDVIFLSTPTTAAGSGVTLTYADSAFGFGGAISNVFQCTHNTSDICLTVASTQDLVKGVSDIVVSGVNGATAANGLWSGIILGDGGANPATTIDLPCSTTCSGVGYTGGGSFITGYLRLDASGRLADAVYFAGSRNTEIVNFQTFQHECGLHFATGTQWARAVNVEIDQYDSINDATLCGIKFDGSAEGNVVTNGEINAAGTDIISNPATIDSPADPNTVENLTLNNTGKSLAYIAMFEVEGPLSSLALAHNHSAQSGYALIADSIKRLTLTANMLPEVNLYFQSSGNAQTNTTGMLNSFASNTPNMATMGNCPSNASQATPFALCGFMSVPEDGYTPSGSPTSPTPMIAMFDNVTSITSTNHYVGFADTADGSGKCHWVIAVNSSGGPSLTVSAFGSDTINSNATFTIPASKMGIFCTYKSAKWWGGTLN